MALMDSIASTADSHELIESYIYIDDDDQETLSLLDRLKKLPFKVTPCIFPRLGSQGSMVEALIKECNASTGVYLPLPDDYIFGNQGWDSDILDAYWQFPDHYGLFYPIDPTVPAGQVTFLFLSAQWVNCLGKLATNFFPYWFDDNWIDEVAQMVQRKLSLTTIMIPPEGRGQTPRMRNLPFWQNYYNCTFDERLKDACKIRQAIWQTDQCGMEASEKNAAQCFLKLRQSGSASDESLLRMESALSPNFGEDREKIPNSYYLMEKAAVSKLKSKAAFYIKTGDIPRALGMHATICKAYSADQENREIFLSAVEKYPKAFLGNIAQTQYRKVYCQPENPLLQIDEQNKQGKIFKPIQISSSRMSFEPSGIVQQAVAHAQLGEWERCCYLLEACSRTVPQIFKQHNICHTFAVALLKCGRKKEALGLALQEIRLNPNNVAAKSIISQLQESKTI